MAGLKYITGTRAHHLGKFATAMVSPYAYDGDAFEVSTICYALCMVEAVLCLHLLNILCLYEPGNILANSTNSC